MNALIDHDRDGYSSGYGLNTGEENIYQGLVDSLESGEVIDPRVDGSRESIKMVVDNILAIGKYEQGNTPKKQVLKQIRQSRKLDKESYSHIRMYHFTIPLIEKISGDDNFIENYNGTLGFFRLAKELKTTDLRGLYSLLEQLGYIPLLDYPKLNISLNVVNRLLEDIGCYQNCNTQDSKFSLVGKYAGILQQSKVADDYGIKYMSDVYELFDSISYNDRISLAGFLGYKSLHITVKSFQKLCQEYDKGDFDHSHEAYQALAKKSWLSVEDAYTVLSELSEKDENQSVEKVSLRYRIQKLLGLDKDYFIKLCNGNSRQMKIAEMLGVDDMGLLHDVLYDELREFFPHINDKESGGHISFLGHHKLYTSLACMMKIREFFELRTELFQSDNKGYIRSGGGKSKKYFLDVHARVAKYFGFERLDTFTTVVEALGYNIKMEWKKLPLMTDSFLLLIKKLNQTGYLERLEKSVNPHVEVVVLARECNIDNLGDVYTSLRDIGVHVPNLNFKK